MADKTPAPAAAASVEETNAYRAELEEEWGTYVAVQPISFNGIPAYNPGDSVPVSNVKKFGYDQGDSPLVQRVGTKAAQEVIAGVHANAIANGSQMELRPAVSLGVPVK